MNSKDKYKPDSRTLDELKKPMIDKSISNDRALIPQIEGHTPRLAEEQVIELNSENTEIAINHIKDTLETLADLLRDLKDLAPASQQGFLFQTAATIAKTRLEGSNMLASLEKNVNLKKENRGGARSNHLHLNVTSAQFGEFVSSQIKKVKDEK
jgi:hypothetical protein